MNNKNEVCKRVMEWVLENRNQPFPADLLDHSNECPDCQVFLQQEKWISSVVQVYAKLAPTGLSPDKFARVYDAIHDISRKESMPVKQVAWKWISVPVAAIMLFLVGYFFAPVFNGETYLSNQFNLQWRNVLHYTPPVREALNVEKSVHDLQFASTYFSSNPEKTFFYANDHFSYEEFLWMQWLGDRTGKAFHEIASDYQTLTPSRLLKKYKIIAKSAKTEFGEKLKQYHLSVQSSDIKVDGIIVKIDYYNHQIWLDSFPYPVEDDTQWIQQARIYEYVNVSLKQDGQKWFLRNVTGSSFQSTNITGVLCQLEPNKLRLSDNPADIIWNQRTFFTVPSLRELLHQSVLIRTMIDNNSQIALTIRKVITPEKRTLTGRIDTPFQYGFTLQGIHQNFVLSEAVTINPMQIKDTIQVSITGEDYGDYMIVTELKLITPPAEDQNILLASASPKTAQKVQKKTTSLNRTPLSTKTSVLKTQTDWIVGINNNQFVFADGTSLPKGNYTIPIGSRVIKTTTVNKGISIQSHQINEMTIQRDKAVFSRKLSNGVYVFLNSRQKKVLYYTNKQLSFDDNSVFLQGRCIEYPELIILIDGRVFQSQQCKTLTGLVIREMEHGKIFLLDDGTLFQVDPFTEIRNGPVAVGKTVKIVGQVMQNTLTAYLIDVQREFAIFQGRITEINRSEKWCRIDSGRQFYWTSDWQLSLILQAMESNKIVYCKAYYENQQWMIETISFYQDGNGEQA